MRKRVFVIQLLILVLSVFMMLGSVTYAWFSKVNKTSIINYDTASLKVEATLYKKDPSNEWTIVNESLTFGVVVPGDTFYFKIKVKNIGTIDGDLTITANDITSSSNDAIDGVFEFLIDGEHEKIDTMFGNTLLDDLVLEPNQEIEFEFAVYATGDLTEIFGHSLTINKINITLKQVEE